MNYSNPTQALIIHDWPYGRNRVKCVFSVETVKGKQRAVRVTDNPKGGTNKPKKLTYADRVCFATGDDGKNYVMQLTSYGSIRVMQSNMKYQQEYFSSGDPRYNDIIKFFDEVNHAQSNI